MYDYIIMAYRETVGDVASYFLMYACFLPLAHVHPLTLPYIFSVGNIKYARASVFNFMVN